MRLHHTILMVLKHQFRLIKTI